MTVEVGTTTTAAYDGKPITAFSKPLKSKCSRDSGIAFSHSPISFLPVRIGKELMLPLTIDIDICRRLISLQIFPKRA